MRHRILTFAAMAALFCGMCIVENSAVKARPVEPATRNASSVYMLAGEFRTVFANLLWIKAEQYHHEYIERHSNWTGNKELVGLLELITTLDPHFIEAYATGFYIYADGYKDDKRALTYLRQALVYNPKSWELHRLAAIMYGGRMKDPERALAHARIALKYCDDEFMHKVMQRLVGTLERMRQEQKAAVRPAARDQH